MVYELSDEDLNLDDMDNYSVHDLLSDSKIIDDLDQSGDARVMEDDFLKRLNRIEDRILELEEKVLEALEEEAPIDLEGIQAKVELLKELKSPLTDEMSELYELEKQYQEMYKDLDEDINQDLEVYNDFDAFVKKENINVMDEDKYFELEELYFEAKELEEEKDERNAKIVWENSIHL